MTQREALITVRTVVRFLLAVSAHVCSEMLRVSRSITTLCADIRALTCVRALMHDEGVAPREALFTVGAGEGFLFVKSLVSTEEGGSFERLQTHAAFVRRFLLMGSHVEVQMTFCCKRLVTLGRLVGSLASVR